MRKKFIWTVLFLAILFIGDSWIVYNVADSSQNCKLVIRLDWAGKYTVTGFISEREWRKKGDTLIGGKLVTFKTSFRYKGCIRSIVYKIKGLSYNNRYNRFEIDARVKNRTDQGIPLKVQLEGIEKRLPLKFKKTINLRNGDNPVSSLEKSDFYIESYNGEKIYPKKMRIICNSKNKEITLILTFEQQNKIVEVEALDPKEKLLEYLGNDKNYTDSKSIYKNKRREEKNRVLNERMREETDRIKKYQNYKDAVRSFLSEWKTYIVYLKQKVIEENKKKSLENEINNLKVNLSIIDETRKILEKLKEIHILPTKYVHETGCKVISITEEVDRYYDSILNYLKKRAQSYYPAEFSEDISSSGSKVNKNIKIKWRTLVIPMDQKKTVIKIKSKKSPKLKMLCCVSAIFALEEIRGEGQISQKSGNNKDILFYDTNKKPSLPSGYEICEEEDKEKFDYFVKKDLSELKKEMNEMLQKQGNKEKYDQTAEQITAISQEKKNIQKEINDLKKKIEECQKDIEEIKKNINVTEKRIKALRIKIEKVRQSYIEAMSNRELPIIVEAKDESREKVVQRLIRIAKKRVRAELLYSYYTSATKEESTYSEEPKCKLKEVEPIACYRKGSAFCIAAKFTYIIKIPKNKACIMDFRSKFFERRKSKNGDIIYYDRLYGREWWFVKEVEKYGVTYTSAKRYFQQNGGKWRLPTRKEIESLKTYEPKKIAVIEEINKYPGLPYWLSEIDTTSNKPLGYCFKVDNERCKKEVNSYDASEGLGLILLRETQPLY